MDFGKYMRNKVLLCAHMSIAGGLEKAIHNGGELGCKTIQIFTKNNNQWKSRQLIFFPQDMT